MAELIDVAVADASGLSWADFAQRYPHPFLALEIDVPDAGREFRTTASVADPGRLARVGRKSTPAVTCTYAALRKRPGANTFSFITIGRAFNNDVVVPSSSVSKCHAVIHRDGPGYAIEDRGSKNGTRVNGTVLEPYASVPIEPEDVVRLSGCVRFRFLDTDTAYGLLGGGQAVAP